MRRALQLFGRDVSPRWILDAMIRTGPFGDRYLPWRDGLSLARLAEHPHGIELGELRTGVLREKLLTRDRKVHLEHEEISRELARLDETLAAGTGPWHEDGAYPFRLVGRRDNRSNNSWLHNVPHLMRGERCRRLRIHPQDATRLGLADGERARVKSRIGAVEVEVRVSDEMMPGVVSLPHGRGEGFTTNRRLVRESTGPNCNALIDHRAIEPLAGMALLNGFPVAVERVAPRARAAG
ncbi:MAG: molybdopterin dinucleotide binding domain-containing protein [Thermodesulfobacteriota bacterium]